MSVLAKYQGKVPMKAYFAQAARHLLTQLGEDALPAADRALIKMQARGDQMGFEMWLGIQDALNAQLDGSASSTVH